MDSFPAPRLLAVALAVFLSAGCAKKPSFEVAHTYALRGRVTQLPEKGRPRSSFMVSHEAIPEFFNAEGEKEGMVAMVMPFQCSDKSLLAPLAVGDKVWMKVVVSKDLVDWDILEIEKLPAGTPLVLADGDASGNGGAK